MKKKTQALKEILDVCRRLDDTPNADASMESAYKKLDEIEEIAKKALAPPPGGWPSEWQKSLYRRVS